MFKKSLAIVLMSTFISIPFASAEESISKESSQPRYVIETWKGELTLFDKKENVHYSKAWSSDGKEISLTEYKANLENRDNIESKITNYRKSATVTSNKSSAESVITPLADPSNADLTTYSEIYRATGDGTSVKATDNVNCANSAQPCPIGVSLSVTTTEQWNVGITAGDKSYVKGTVGFTWNSTSASAQSYGLFVPIGKTGYLTYTPVMTFTAGYLNYKAMINWVIYDYGSKFVDAASPVKRADGKTDGTWALVLTN